MAQLLFPFFPSDVEYLNPRMGVQKLQKTVWYYHVGEPIFSHSVDDNMKFRYITSQFIINNRCSVKDVCRVFLVSADSVRRYKKKLIDQGEVAFFGPENRHGHCYKMNDEKIEEAQRLLDEGRSQNSIGKQLGVREGTIRYWIKQGNLKKKTIT